MFKGWTTFIDTSKLAGWVRAAVAAGLGMAIAHWPALGQWIDPVSQEAIGAAVATVIVGVWSHIAKKVDS